jgi:hypothetical protein
MKKFIALSLLLSCLFTLSSCNIARETPASSSPVSSAQQSAEPSGPSSPAPAASAPLPDLASYLPIRENTRYVYEGTGNEYASYEVWTDYTSEGRVQQRVNNGGTELARVLALEEGKLKKVYTREEAYYRETCSAKRRFGGNSPDERLRKEPPGGCGFPGENDYRYDRRNPHPAGTYTAVEVSRKERRQTADYYAQTWARPIRLHLRETEVRSALSESRRCGMEADRPVLLSECGRRRCGIRG